MLAGEPPAAPVGTELGEAFCLQDLADAVFHGPIPALTLAGDRRIVDYNIALECLFADALSGLRGAYSEALRTAVSPYVVDGAFLAPAAEPTNGDPATTCTVSSREFGTIVLERHAVDHHRADGATSNGQIVFWKPTAFPESEVFRARYRSLLDHQLTWATYAWSYDRILPLMPYYQEVLRRHREVLCGATPGVVIDLGAGTGNLISQLVETGMSVIAVDSSRAMLDRLRSKPALARELGRRVRLIEASATALPMVESDSCSAASILLALYDMERPHAALDEAIRILRPGGILVVTEPKIAFELTPILEACREQLARLNVEDALADDFRRVVEANRSLDPAPRAPLRAETVHRVLTDRGFTDMRVVDSHFGQCATVCGRKPGRADEL